MMTLAKFTIAGIEIDTECGDVNTVAIQYDDCMRKLLDKHACTFENYPSGR